jgi:methionyl-tRNA formyltransferase
MRIVYLGSGEFGLNSLDAINQSGHELLFIVTQPPLPAGRGRKTRPTPVACWASEKSIPFIETDNVNTAENIEKIARYKPDLIVVIAFGQKIGTELINLPLKGAINIHASLLPKYRGAAPITWAIINGETETGISIIALAEKMDAGAVCGTAKTEIEPDETAGELHDRLARIAAPLLIETLDKIEAGTIQYTEQDHSKATLAPKLKKTDGFLDFAESAEVLQRKILGLTPWPGASAMYVSGKTGKKERITITSAQIVHSQSTRNLSPGILDDNFNVVCGKDALKIIQIKPAGSGLMSFKAFANGRSTAPGDYFVKIED